MHAILTREAMILDEEATAKVRRTALSASTAKTLSHNCAAQFAFSKLAGEKRPDPFAVTDQGTAAHAVLEELYKLPPAKRTQRRAINILLAFEDEWQRSIYPQLGNPVTRAKFQSEVMEKYKGIFEIEDPRTIDVVRTEWKMNGITLGDVPFTGYIDRVERVTARGNVGLRVSDYKTGRQPPKAKIERYGDDHGDQIRLYAAALATSPENDETVLEGRVHYTRYGKSTITAVAKQRVNQTVGEFVRSWDIHNEMADSGRFPTKTGPLCGWCPLVHLCPASQASRFSTDRTESQNALETTDICEIEPTPVQSLETDAGAHRETPAPPTGASNPADPQDPDEGDSMADHKLTEDKPWEVTSYGVLNGNSYASTGYFGTASLAYEYMGQHGVPVQKVTLPLFAEALAGIVSEVQEALSGSTSFQDGTNTRIRGVLRSVIEFYPAPFGGDADAWTTWRSGTVQRVKAICSTALRLHAHEGAYAFDAEAMTAIAPKN